MKILTFLILLLFILFPFGQLTRLSPDILPAELISLPEVNLYLIDLIVAAIVSYWLVWKLVGKSKFVLPPLSKPIFLFLIFASLSLIFKTPFRANLQAEPLLSGRELVVAGLYLIRWTVYAGLYFVVNDLVSGQAEKKLRLKNLIQNLLISAGTIVAILGLLQYFFLPNTKFLKYLHWDPHYYRAIGTFLDPAFLGMILVLVLILLTARHWQKIIKPRKSSSVHYIIFSVLYTALALTHSRSSYLAFLVGMGVIAWKKKAPKFFLVTLLVVFLTILVLPRPSGEGGKLARTYTIEARIRNWQQSARIAKDNLLFGVGFNAYRYVQRDYGFLKENWQVSHSGAGADSSLLFVLATTGIFGFISYLWLWGKILGFQPPVIIASAWALLAHSFFNNSLFYAWIMIWLWTLLAISFLAKVKGSN